MAVKVSTETATEVIEAQKATMLFGRKLKAGSKVSITGIPGGIGQHVFPAGGAWGDGLKSLDIAKLARSIPESEVINMDNGEVYKPVNA